MGTTNTLDLNNRVTNLEKAVSGGDSAQANKKDIATEFSATTNYTAGCYVYYGGKLYQFNADHSAGAWDPTDAVEANVTDQVVSNAAAIAGLTASDVMMADGVTSVEDALDEIKSGLMNHFKTITSGSLHDITESGIYYLTGSVTDKPISLGGMYILSVLNRELRVGIYISYNQDAGNKQVALICYHDNVWDIADITSTKRN